MKPLYTKKNGTVNKMAAVEVTMPASYPASNVTYDPTTSGLSATRVQGAIDEVKADLFNDTINTLTAGSHTTVQAGGYAQIGRLVILNFRVTFDSNCPAYDPVVTGLPHPKTSGGSVVAISCNNSAYSGGVSATGKVEFINAVPSGQTLQISACYICE